jgi:hypothetical protein
MKDLIKKIFIIGFSSVLILYVILRLSINFLLHKELIDSIELTIESLIFALVFTLLQEFILIQFLKPKIAFLNSASPMEKKFGNVEENINIDDENFDIENFTKSLRSDFVITYSDKNIIKVRDKFNFWSWGAAAVISINIENKNLKISAFSFNGTPGTKGGTINKKIRKLIDKIKAKI